MIKVLTLHNFTFICRFLFTMTQALLILSLQSIYSFYCISFGEVPIIKGTASSSFRRNLLCKSKEDIGVSWSDIEASILNTFCKCFRLSPFFICSKPLSFTLLIHTSNEQFCIRSCLHIPAVNSISSSISFRKETPLLFCKLR